ncbi:hypothetical protein CLAFUW4_14589 [Fulvia fulva]|uniref:Uncharacterized protein n=1 Tax=Passalora fulva TaxID=5499 RepID=A0A9Q8UWF0_PASFU|nr:uncharacterized protein CLAFUR5_14419 [Fulvia fulva]KAK4609129.1 hypothetical protein CLAFUR4_14583 [Fulvia fulva]KAK4609515.1 hypothetical protein CLAFUR0_14583 [Fulvia fulva]UJO24925.1 hypothetical protein CLAFUR5_14419 [Fulvia fulva]WPV22572.1 hypothetical protein CLAFUW4_14589 [Fulvia fulva]WPV37489.1 hypothetical protein CLAFUW7_14592 [Fulvia fulva]
MGGPSLISQNSQQLPTPKRARSTKIKKKRVDKDEFALEWLTRFVLMDRELEDAREPKPQGGLVVQGEDGEDLIVNDDDDDDYQLRQLDAVGHGLDLLEAWDDVAKGVMVTKKSFPKEIWLNPFTAADALRTFVINFLATWQTIKHEKFYHGQQRHAQHIKQFAKKLNAMLERAHKMAPNVINKVRGAAGGRLRKARAGDDDDGDEE